jgi:hypothetical protein
MKKIARPLITLGIGLFLAFFSAALTYIPSSNTQSAFSSAAFFSQTTPTPEQQDRSEIGSTDQIVVLGVAICIIVVLPILLRRKSWLQLK